MNSGNTTLTKRFLITLGMLLTMATVILSGVFSSVALADDGDPFPSGDPDPGNVTRTIMIYLDGAASEENNSVCSAMLKEYMASHFNRSDLRIIVMTGGSLKWHLDASYLRDKDGNAGTLTEISSEYNQIWEVYGATDDAEGSLRLLDGDGVRGDGADARTSADELMSDPDTLQKFINYAYSIAPAGKIDLILNDHGSGPRRGYGYDDHDTANPDETLSVLQLRQAISGSDVVQDKGKFDFVDFDCCVMGNFETVLALADYTDYFLGSADVNPFATVDYTALFDFLATDPDMDAWILGRKLVNLLEGTNARLVKDSCSNLGINDVEFKLSISDMYDVKHEVKPELSFDPRGGTWADGGSDVREYEAGLETEFDIIDAPTRDGYTFVCWKGSEYQPGDK